MQISDAAAQYNASIVSNTSSAVKNQGVERTVSNVRNLQPGHVFEGTVGSIKNGVVTIGLSTGDTLSARLDSGVSLNQGDSVFFQVRSNSDNVIQIRALTGQNSFNPTLEKALNAASLPINAENLTLVNTMMQEHMSIDSASLNAMARLIAKHPMADISTAIQMNKLGITMSPENISQFENYKADEGAILKELGQVMDSLPQALASSELSLDQAVNLGREIVSILTDGLVENPVIPEGITEAEAQALLDGEAAIAGKDAASIMPEMEAAGTGAQALAEQALFEGVGTQDAQGAEAAPEGQETAAMPQASPEEALSNMQQVYQNTDIDSHSMGATFDPKSLLTFSDELKSMPAVHEELKSFLREDGNLDPGKSTAEFMNALTKALPHASKDEVSKLFRSEGFQKGIKSLMEQQWLLEPKQVSEGKDTIKELYAKLENQMKELENAMTRAGIPHENFSAAAQDVSNNIDFMNQLNQAYTFVQLPLKMSGQNANGDLYVYTNKKALKDPDSELSAFLHFDLDNLGTTDISVKMLRKNVTTHFYLESEEAMELIANNIHLLDNRLKAKGYTCSTTVSNEAKKQDFVHDFLMKDEKNVGTVHRYSFDVRA